uniref:CCHC-type domain-containing protein n=1 Tax=Rhodnius prolixus TaxID=13249 RepID=T1H9W3_RHOPR
MEMYLTEKDLWDVIWEEKPNAGKTLLTWEKKDKCARAKIVLSVEDNQLMHIKHEVTAAVDKLRCIGKVILDEDIIAVLLCSLPVTYDSLITSLEGRPESELSLDYVKNKLIETSERRHENSKTDDMVAMKANKFSVEKQERKSNSSNSLGATNRMCYYCGKPGHIKKYCYIFNSRTRPSSSYEE